MNPHATGTYKDFYGQAITGLMIHDTYGILRPPETNSVCVFLIKLLSHCISKLYVHTFLSLNDKMMC